MEKDRLKIGILGFADDFMYKLTETLAKNNLIEITSITDSIRKRGEKAASKYNITYEPDIYKFIKNSNVEAICVGSEIESRKDIILQVINSKKHVLCLYPIAKNLEDTEEIISTAKKQKAKLYVPLKLRYYERFQEIRELCIKEGRKVGSIHVTYRDKKSDHHDILNDLGIYTLDLIRWFTGLEINKIYAEIGGESNNIDTAENILMLMYLNNGGFASVEISYDHEEEIYLNILHDDMFTQIMPLKQHVLLRKLKRDIKYSWNINPHEFIADEFIKYVLYDKPLNTSLDDVYKSSELVVAVKNSINKGLISVNLN
jgi:UDP-N-acetylglucosamine 3-dehydrogenase